ncbi:hypothetical protein BKA61DRAFT_470893 [Leptodontidium sp. MPI-SDFR-AT-0119]|nr:hypothetical protein BKA61DRAFT_470893 [Leptodontidium sp. MPI-SDFR-AT-0119]
MPGKLQEWPAWPEFVQEKRFQSEDPDYLACKKDIIAEFGEEALRASWIQVCKDLESVTSEISSKRSDMIPVFDIQHILNEGFSADEKAELKRVGCFVVRDVVPEAEARNHYQNLRQYVDKNRSRIDGWPQESPSMLLLYNSPTQIAIRTHPNHLRLQRKMNELWHDESGEASAEPLLYSDGVRDRPPKQAFLGLGPHIDAGSLCRWADPTYRKSYGSIFAGKPRSHDAFDLNIRKSADQYLFPGIAHSTVFRSFQGWTALTRAAAGEGAIMLYPNVSTAIAYVLLRPFFTPPSGEADILDATKWKFDADSSFFPGTFKPQSQLLSRNSHPHLRLESCLVHIPTLKPGDTIWWHTDTCHAVDSEHNGAENASVVYIAACPTTDANKVYVKSQLESFLAGRPPPDYASNTKLDESTLEGYTGHETLLIEAKMALGYGL